MGEEQLITEGMARSIVKQKLPDWKISKVVNYKGLYIFLMLEDGPEEGLDPFYSVHQKTGKFAEYPVIDLSNEDWDALTTLFKGGEDS